MANAETELATIKTALRALAGSPLVATAWPKAFDTLPCIIVQQAGETSADSRDDAEYLTEIEWYVRVFGTHESPHLALCRAVYQAMIALGYARTFRYDEGDAYARSTVFRFQKTI